MNAFDPKSSETTGYHLFLEPEGAVRGILEHAIADCATQGGGPIFTPHATLLARIEKDESFVLTRARSLAEELAPIRITLGEPAMEEAYFRALYIGVSSPSFVHAHARACELFDTQDIQPYVPHVSLFYGNTGEAEKQSLLDSLLLPTELTWSARALHVYHTPGDTTTWKRIESIPLTGSVDLV